MIPTAPFALKTDLGWSIVGIIDHSPEVETDPIGHSHRIAASIITGSRIPERRKEVASPSGGAAKDVYSHSTGHTSPQDLPLIKVSTSLCNRLFWIMVFTMATLLLIGHSATITPKFVKSDTTTSVSTINMQVEFPNTIICNTEPAREVRYYHYETDEPGILRDIKPKGGRKRLKTRNK